MEEPVDDFTKRLMERARERREILSRKMADTSNRKRSSPITENRSEFLTQISDNTIQEAINRKNYALLISPPQYTPNKRYCSSRNEEKQVHSDTPAITGVKSRMKNLMASRSEWLDEGLSTQNKENRKAFQSPMLEDKEKSLSKNPVGTVIYKSPPKFSSTYSINVQKGSGNKNETKIESVTMKSPIAVKKFTLENSPNKPESVTKKSPMAVRKFILQNSPNKPDRVTTWSPSSIKTVQKSPGKTYESKTETVTMKSPSATRKDFTNTHRDSDVHEPTKKPVSARLASWQQKVENIESVPEHSHQPVTTPQIKSSKASVQPVSVAKSISAIPPNMDLNTTLANDPLNMSIHSRRNVWENKIEESNKEKNQFDQMYFTPKAKQSSASGIYKSPAKFNSTYPVAAQKSPGKMYENKAETITMKSPVGNRKDMTKPFQDKEAQEPIKKPVSARLASWQQKAETVEEHLQQRISTPQLKISSVSVQSISKSVPGLLNKEIANSTDVPAAPPPPPVSSKDGSSSKKIVNIKQSSCPRREADRSKMRKGNDDKCEGNQLHGTKFEDKLQMMGFEMNTSHSAIVDLTPFKHSDQRASGKNVTTPKKQAATKMEIEEIKTTSVKFDDKERVTIKRNVVTTPCITDDVADISTPSISTPVRQFPKPTTGTPSIYSLIKKNTATSHSNTPSTSANVVSASAKVRSKGPNVDRDSFSDDSFDDEPMFRQPNRYTSPSPKKTVKQPSPHLKIAQNNKQSYKSSQVSLASNTSEYSETQTTDYTSQEDDYSEADYTETTEHTESEEEDEDNGEVSDLLDEVLSNDEDDSETSIESHHKSGVQIRQKNSVKSRPISQPPYENRRAGNNTKDYYDSIGQRNSAPSQPDKRVQFEYSSESTTQYTSESETEPSRATPYSIDMYRQSKSKINAPVPKMTIVRQPEYHRKEPIGMEIEEQLPPRPPKPDRQRLQALQDRINQEQSVIMQTSNALNQCCGQNMQFAGSQEAVECHKLLLIACKKREAYINEMHRLKHNPEVQSKGVKGSLSISNISLPLKQEFKRKIGGPNDLSVHYFLLLMRHKDHVVFTQMVSTHNEMVRDSLDIPNLIKFNDVKQDFKVDVEVYGMNVTKEPANQTPSKKKKGGTFTPKKLLKKGGLHVQSPGGPLAVRSTNFVLVAHMQLNARSQAKTHFMLENVPFSSPLQGSIHLRLHCLIESHVEERGFLTMFEDVSGFGAWHRRWFTLKDGFVSYWKYPDDERLKEPLGYFDMKQCITDTVGLIPRDICARPNTFELITVRRQSRGETDTLVSRCYNTMTTTKHWLSADTKEERILWCNRLNEALTNIRTWNSDALRPITRNDMITPYNPYPNKADQRECIIPFNPHDQQSTC